MKRITLLSILIFSFSTHADDFLSKIQKSDLNKNEQVVLPIYKNSQTDLEKNAEIVLDDKYSPSNKFKLDFKNDEWLTWNKFELLSSYYIEQGFIAEADQKDHISKSQSSNDFMSIIDQYSEDVDNEKPNKYQDIFHYSFVNMNNNIKKFDKTVEKCSSPDKDKMDQCVKKYLVNSKNILDKITLNCMNGTNSEEIKKCRTDYVNSQPFKQKLATVYYNLGVFLYDNKE